MLNSFLGVETISRGLFMQQVNQDITASNMAKTYLDSDGYLMASRQRLDIMEGSPLLFGNMGGVKAVGTGPMIQQITRLRSLFLDGQIRTESSILGKSEILAEILPQIQAMLNGATGTLDSALTDLAASFTALAANPLSIALRSDVVNDGVAFADLARAQFNGLQTLQYGLDGDIKQTLGEINQLLGRLAQYNTHLLNSQGANLNDVLDARDYALAKLSRLVSIQANIRANGTLDIQLQGSGLALLDASGASTLESGVRNSHNVHLASVNVVSSHGSVSNIDAATFIKGGRLGGLLEARDVLAERYKTQVDQVVTSVLNVTNNFHQSGYASDGITTDVLFFTGTGAADINVNGSLVADTTRALLAASSRSGLAAVATNGEIAQFIGGLKGLLANNFMQTPGTGSGIGVAVDPTQPILSQVFLTAPNPAGGSFTVNGVAVNWTTTDSIDDILDAINAADPNVHAVFNMTQGRFYLYSSNPINIIDTAGNFTDVGILNNVLTSTIRMNNGFSPTDTTIVFGLPFPLNSALNSPLPGQSFPGQFPPGPNTQAFRVTPSASGSFVVNGFTVTWDNTQSLYTILAAIPTTFPGTLSFTSSFDPNTQTVTLYSAQGPRPIQIVDTKGNFTVFTGLNGNTPIGNLSSGLLAQVDSELLASELSRDQARASLEQLNTAQANIGALSTVAGEPGVPIQIEQENAIKSLIAFNAALQVMGVINQMYSDLVNIIGVGNSSNFLQQRV